MLKNYSVHNIVDKKCAEYIKKSIEKSLKLRLLKLELLKT